MITKRKVETELKDIVALSKRRGFVYPSSELYGGLANTFDYGPYGVELLRNLKNSWWKAFVQDRDDVLGLDSSIIVHPKVWEASGHASHFSDPLMDCKECKTRIRVDDYLQENFKIDCTGMSLADLQKQIDSNEDIPCPKCKSKKKFTKVRQFNLMFSTEMGSTEESNSRVYLRPETAQGIFINFKNVIDSCRIQIPFGIAQIGKSFRNEIIARQFIFRTREFEQLEMEFFCKPGEQNKFFDYWVDFCQSWLLDIGIQKKNIKLRPHEQKELSFYSERTIDIEYKFPFGWGELWGIASRTDYDLKQHAKYSSKNIIYQDPMDHSKYIPYVIEPALGLNRLFLAVLSDSYAVSDAGTKAERRYLKLHPKLAPITAAIFPLVKNKSSIMEKTQNIYKDLRKKFKIDFDINGSIGKRYYRQDELGTPFCFTVDHESLEDDCLTVRERNTAKQERIYIDKIEQYLKDELKYDKTISNN